MATLLTNNVSDYVLRFTIPTIGNSSGGHEHMDTRTGYLSTGLAIFVGLLAGIVTLMTILQNMVVVLAFCIDHSTRKPSNYFLLSLALSDLIIGVWGMPTFTQYVLMNEWVLGPWFCRFWLTLNWTVFQTGQCTVFLITIDRYLSIKIPAKHRMWGTKTKAKLIITASWLVSAAVYITSIFFWDYFVPSYGFPHHHCDVEFLHDKAFILLLSGSYIFIMLVGVLTFYALIYRIALSLHLTTANRHTDRLESRRERMDEQIVSAQTRRDSRQLGKPMQSSTQKQIASRYIETKTSEMSDDTAIDSNSPLQEQDYNVSSRCTKENGRQGRGSRPSIVGLAGDDLTSKESQKRMSAHSIRRLQLAESMASDNNDAGISVSDCVCEFDTCRMDTEQTVVEARFSPVLTSTCKHAEASPTDSDFDENEKCNALDPIEDGNKLNDKTPIKEYDEHTSTSDTSVLSETRSRSFRTDVLQNATQEFSPREKPLSGDNHLKNRARKAFRMITLILACHFVCMTPYYMTIIYMAFYGYYSINKHFYYLVYWMCYLNSLLDPYCYAYANVHFRRALLRILKLDWHRN